MKLLFIQSINLGRRCQRVVDGTADRPHLICKSLSPTVDGSSVKMLSTRSLKRNNILFVFGNTPYALLNSSGSQSGIPKRTARIIDLPIGQTTTSGNQQPPYKFDRNNYIVKKTDIDSFLRSFESFCPSSAMLLNIQLIIY